MVGPAGPVATLYTLGWPFAVSILIVVSYVGIWIITASAILRIQRERFGFAALFHIVAHGSLVAIFGLVPLIGSLVALVWWWIASGFIASRIAPQTVPAIVVAGFLVALLYAVAGVFLYAG